MNDQIKEAAHNVGESVKDLAEKLEILAKAAFAAGEDKARDVAGDAEPYIAQAAAKIRSLADEAEVLIAKAKQKPE